MSHKGTIKTKHLIPGALFVRTSLGRVRVEETFGFYESEQFGNRIINRVSRLAINGNLRVRRGESLRSRHEQLVHAVNDVCKLLSLCCRKPVDWYYIRYLPKKWECKGSFLPPEPFVRRRIALPDDEPNG